ncbi:MAG: Ribosomal RNA small subunit methyltransferase H [Candidatus Nomurabacteria bacterium GW2011_GWA1_36_15]|uniref:Ribosomal RNA small subunit methyltransferase H n=1 Tax=Candidatus Nomurabacteria bacterium GW2011_GWA1_36_15 TaxID=1618728 RepID=A0A0G0H282_9BACT|nr:MAG: Ribosomal RNA small subunit methyltransferase H [Candidatus Nomurabacteria bacterium GW2011_GWA1_36_15]
MVTIQRGSRKTSRPIGRKVMRESIHKTVLLNETIEGLNLQNKSVVLDATFGGGGHSKAILEKYPNVKIIALDQDKSVSKSLIDPRISFHNLNFRDLDKVLEKGVDGIIFDLGLSSDQLENSGRGFSFIKNEPLLMTMKEKDIIYGYGEERFSRRIAKGIIEARKKNKIETTWDLVKVIENNVPVAYRKGRLHFATKTFQALRIAVNDELRTLQTGLQKGFEILEKGGRISVISFHSLEDRIVKRFYKEKEKKGEAKLISARNEFRSGGNKEVILASAEEIKNNPRSRSGKLRILEKKT